MVVGIISMLSMLAVSQAGDLDGMALATKVAERPSDDTRTGIITFTLRNKQGKERQRRARMAVTETDDTHQIVLAFDKPANIRQSAFLSYDHKDPGRADETWLFLPATERTRRVPASDRSDAFMGTELSYGDVKDDFKFGLGDYHFEARGLDEGGMLRLTGKAIDSQTAKRIGYGGFDALIDPYTWFPRLIVFNDHNGETLKTIKVETLDKVGETLSATRFDVTNHQTGRSTQVSVDDLTAAADLPTTLFEADHLDRAARRLP